MEEDKHAVFEGRHIRKSGRTYKACLKSAPAKLNLEDKDAKGLIGDSDSE